MPYKPSRGVYRFIDDELNVPHHAGGHRAKQPLPRRDIEAAARQKNLRNTTRKPPDAYPKVRQQPSQTWQQPANREDEDELYADKDLHTRPPRSAMRYIPIADEGIETRQGIQVEHHYHNQPIMQRRSRQHYDEYEEDYPVRRRRGVRLHYLVFVGVAILLMLAGYFALNLFGAWWLNHQDDVTYGNPRMFHIDAVVGHFDSPSHPTHFIAMNLKGHIIVIELPGGDTSKARSYNITTIPDNAFNPPVRLVFQDLTHDGRLDMVIEIGDPGSVVTIFMYNNGVQFVPKL